MDDKPRALHGAFPEHADPINRLQEEDPEFRRKRETCHDLSRAAHRAEMQEEPVEEVASSEMRKRRDLAQDELMRLILR